MAGLPYQAADAATVCYGSDRSPVTVVSVEGNLLTAREDNYVVVSGNVVDGSAEYEYSANESAPLMLFRRSRKDPERYERVVRDSQTQRLRKSYGTLYVGTRRRYYDPHF